VLFCGQWQAGWTWYATIHAKSLSKRSLEDRMELTARNERISQPTASILSHFSAIQVASLLSLPNFHPDFGCETWRTIYATSRSYR